MKKLALLGLLVALSTGCGRSWLPLFRGAPCNGNSCLPAALTPTCNPCGGAAAGYGAYDGEVVGGTYYGGDAGYYDGAIIDSGRIIDGTINSPSMTPVAPPGN